MEYMIPQEIKDSIDEAFLEQLHEEMHCIFGISLDSFEMNEIFQKESTTGFTVAFLNACKKCKKDNLIKYAKGLDWDESDLFDNYMIDKMKESKMILPNDEESEIERQLGIPKEIVYQCIQCGKFYKKKDVKQLVDEETKELVSACECKNCSNGESVSEILIDRKRAILEHLKYKESDFFQCKKCRRFHLKRWMKGTICHNCDILSHSKDEHRNRYFLKARATTLQWSNNL